MVYDTIVVGGGITGLVAAYYLSKREKTLLVEKEKRLGGNIRTLRDGNYTFEEGPQTILANNGAVFKLLDDLGLKPQKASPSSEKRYIYKGGRLVPIPLKPQEFFKTDLVGWRSKLKLLAEFFAKPSQREDESVADFVRRHFGEEFLSYFVQPFISGIYAGDAKRLSVRYAFPKLWEMEKKYGSLLRAFLKERRVAPKGELISFRGGLQTLVEKLAEGVPEKLLGTKVLSVEKRGETYGVITERGTFEAKRVILTTPADETAGILRKLFPPIELLETIEYPSLAVVSLAFRETPRVEGFGFLTPKVEGIKILGAIFVRSLFPDRCPEGEECFSVFLCGATRRELCSLGEEELLKIAEGELRRILNLKGETTFRKIRLWRRSIPQYTVGYGRIYETLGELEKKFPNLKVISNFVGGSSLAKCIEKGLKVSVF